MPASITNPADVVNLALGNIGYKLTVGTLYEGSEAARAALQVYGQARDDAMREGDWDFCQRRVAAELSKAAPADYFTAPWNPATNPPLPWKFSYLYPSDCLKVRAVLPPPTFLFNPAPTPQLFTVLNDQGSTPAIRVICCNIEGMVLTYAGQVTNPASWPSDFVDALAASLGRRLAPVLADLQTAGLAARLEGAETQMAAQQQG